MKKIIMTKGLPGAGKSTWSKEMVTKNPGKYKRLSKDDLRAMLDNSLHSKTNEKFILHVRDTLVRAALEQGYSVIIDDTNLHPKHEQQLQQIASSYKGQVSFEIKDFTSVDIEECIQRDLKRSKTVGERVIKDMWNMFLKPLPADVQHISGVPSAIICDMDGTLSLLNGRDPYDASTCEKDLPNRSVYDVIQTYSVYKEDYLLFIVSARPDTHREQTVKWLQNHGIVYDYLFMRKEGDMRKDSIVKQEIYEQQIKGRVNVVFVLDDRKQVVEMWRQQGLTCLQVAEGDF